MYWFRSPLSKSDRWDSVRHLCILSTDIGSWSGLLSRLMKYAIPITTIQPVNAFRPRQSGCHFTDDNFKGIFVNENAWLSLKIPLTFLPMVSINSIPELVQIMAWRRLGDRPLSESIVVTLLTLICFTRPQWVNESHRCEGVCYLDCVDVAFVYVHDENVFSKKSS